MNWRHDLPMEGLEPGTDSRIRLVSHSKIVLSVFVIRQFIDFAINLYMFFCFKNLKQIRNHQFWYLSLAPFDPACAKTYGCVRSNW